MLSLFIELEGNHPPQCASLLRDTQLRTKRRAIQCPPQCPSQALEVGDELLSSFIRFEGIAHLNVHFNYRIAHLRAVRRAIHCSPVIIARSGRRNILLLVMKINRMVFSYGCLELDCTNSKITESSIDDYYLEGTACDLVYDTLTLTHVVFSEVN